ncbi:aminotransferase, partial [Pseudomonas syringae pv. tagetis]
CAIQSVIRTVDEVIIFDGWYVCYEPAVELAGGRCVHVQLAVDDFSIDWQMPTHALRPRTRKYVIISPRPPCGGLMSRAQ